MYTGTFAPALHLSSLLEAGQKYAILYYIYYIILLRILFLEYSTNRLSTQWNVCVHLFLTDFPWDTWDCIDLYVFILLRITDSNPFCLYWVFSAMLGFLTVSGTFFDRVSLSFMYFCSCYVDSLCLSYLPSLLTLASGITMLSNAQLGGMSWFKHGRGGLRCCSE